VVNLDAYIDMFVYVYVCIYICKYIYTCRVASSRAAQGLQQTIRFDQRSGATVSTLIYIYIYIYTYTYIYKYIYTYRVNP